MKIYLTCFKNATNVYMGYALTETGIGICSHMSSSVEFSKHDLGLTSNWKHDLYEEYSPYELVWVENPRNHKGWLKAVTINRRNSLASIEQIEDLGGVW